MKLALAVFAICISGAAISRNLVHQANVEIILDGSQFKAYEAAVTRYKPEQAEFLHRSYPFWVQFRGMSAKDYVFTFVPIAPPDLKPHLDFSPTELPVSYFVDSKTYKISKAVAGML